MNELNNVKTKMTDMVSPITIDGVLWFYRICSDVDQQDWTEYILFGKLEEVPDWSPDFIVCYNIENPRYTKEEIYKFIKKELEWVNRIDEIKRGEII